MLSFPLIRQSIAMLDYFELNMAASAKYLSTDRRFYDVLRYHATFIYRRFNARVSQLKMHYFSEGAFESLIASQLLKKEKYI